MTFFNPKEEVLDIELTQYGRHLLSKGVMSPSYYAFFDEGVVYDVGNAGLSEAKNDAEKRIQDETPSNKTQHCFTGRDEFLFDGINDKEDRLELGIYEKMFTLTDELGTSQLGSTKMPYFSLNFLEGKIKSSINHLTGSTRQEKIPSGSVTSYSQQLLKIPQISVNMEYSIATVDSKNPQFKFESDASLSRRGAYKNGLSVVVGPEDILILAEEGNTSCGHKNFDIEVFEMTGLSGSLGEEIMTPMSFRKPLEMIKNNLLLSPEEAAQGAGKVGGASDSSFVEYYLDIRTDGEISRSIVCDSLHRIKNKGRNIYSPCGIEVDCPDIRDVIVKDIYASDGEEEKC
jgi:hypothetical protein